MTVNPNIPLAGQQVDTATGVYKMQQQQNQNAESAQRVLGQYYQNLDAREQSRLTSTIAGAAQLKTFLDNDDLQGAENFLRTRRQTLTNRMGTGEAIDTQDTDAAIQMLQSGNVDELKNNVDGLLAAGRVYGIVDSAATEAGGNTGVLVNRLIQEGSAKDVNEALQLIKGGAGQMGRNVADIQLGGQAAYATTAGGKQAELEYNPQIAVATDVAKDKSEQERADLRALPVLQKMIELNEDTFDMAYLEALQGPARIAGFEKQTTAFDLMRQNRLNLAAPLAKALGVNPTDKDFQATLDRIMDANAGKASRRAQLEQLIGQIQQRQRGSQATFVQPESAEAKFREQFVTNQTQQPQGRIEVFNPQTGEAFEIDATDLADAQAEGFQQR